MRPLIRRIVAGVAALRPDDPALAAALRLSAQLGAELYLLHVETGDAPSAVAASLGRTSALRGVAESAQPGCTMMGRVTCRVATGAPDQRLLEAAEARDADLVVLGATRRGALAGTFLGTTAGRVLRGARAPILVVRGALPEQPKRVLLTTDLSHHAAYAHARGGALARALCAPGEVEMRSLFVEPPILPDEAFSGRRIHLDAEGELTTFLQAEVPSSCSTPCVRGGDPASEIVREARDWAADLLVLGTHGRRGASRLFLGSVAETVLRHAPCATLVIPPLRAYHMALDHAALEMAATG
jgi:universal stress protein E